MALVPWWVIPKDYVAQMPHRLGKWSCFQSECSHLTNRYFERHIYFQNKEGLACGKQRIKYTSLTERTHQTLPFSKLRKVRPEICKFKEKDAIVHDRHKFCKVKFSLVDNCLVIRVEVFMLLVFSICLEREILANFEDHFWIPRTLIFIFVFNTPTASLHSYTQLFTLTDQGPVSQKSR